jgi:hypothetical protein
LSTPGTCAAISTFDSGNEGWAVIGGAQSGSATPNFSLTGGNPGGYVSATDDDIENTWYWQAPSKFLGNVACVYGQALNFDLRQATADNQFDGEDVILEGGGLVLVYDTPYNPGPNWTTYAIPLMETAGWKKNALNGTPPTPTEMQAVLSALTQLRLRGEYRDGADTGHLDNVIFNAALKGVGPILLTSYQLNNSSQLSGQGDGADQTEPADQVGLTLELTNHGIQTATGVMATLKSSDPDVVIFNNGNSWPDIPAGTSQVSTSSFGLEIASDLSEKKLVTFTLTVTASNGGPWISTFDILIGSKPTSVFLPLILRNFK